MSASGEAWRPIPGYEETYEASSEGRIRSIPRPRTRGGLLKVHVGKRGYPVVTLVQLGAQRSHTVHRLVALAFLGECPEGQEVRHLDGNRLNSASRNLAYGSSSENHFDKRGHGTDHNVMKTHCPRGHAYAGDNIYVLPSRPTARYCRTCERARSLRRYHANRAS